MSENNKTYNSYSSNNLNPGHELEIEHTIYSNFDKLDISDFIQLSVDEVQGMYEVSADSVRFENPDVCVIESTPYVFSYRIVSFDCRPYRTEVQLYKSLCALEKSIIREALTDGQREAFERLHCIMSNLEYRFYKTFGVEISDVSTVYSECSFGLVPWVDEPSVCMMHDWIMLPSA